MSSRFRLARRFTTLVTSVSLISGASLAAAPDGAPAQDSANAANAAAPLPPLAESLGGAAKADYNAALILYDDKDYAGAVVKFLSAYDTSHDARLLWNAAACQKNLRHYAKAMALVRRYVAAGEPYVTPATRAEADTFLRAVEPLTAKLTVVTTEPDATVSVDDEPMATTPLVEALVVDLGAREVTIAKDGFKPWRQTVQVAGSRDVQITATLEKVVHRGRVVVHAGPDDTILFDGRGVGSGTWESSVSSGGHTVRVTAAGKVPYQSEVLVQDGQTRRLDVTLLSQSSGIPLWVWIVGGTVVAAGAATGGYFALRPSEPGVSGSIGLVSMPLRSR